MRVAVCLAGLLIGLSGSLVALGQSLEQQVDRLMASYNQAGQPGASVLIAHKGEILLAKGYGTAHLEERQTAGADTNYRLASVSKAFTAMAALILVDEGKLTLETKLTDIFSDFPSYGRLISVYQLLTHTSGLRDYESHIPGGQREQLKDEDVVNILKGLSSTYFTPGTSYRYSNSGYATLAHIVATVSGMRFSTFLEERIFQPLGMDQTVAFENGINTVANRAYGYTQSGSGFRQTDQSMTSAVLGDGGVYTSPVDYFKWDQALYDDTLISESLRQQMFERGRTSGGQSLSYGFGWMIGSHRGAKRVSHTGSTIGFRTAVERIPEKEICVLVLINRAGSLPWNLARQMVDLVWDR